MIQQSIPTQESHDPSDPEEHFLWALRNMPMFAGVGAITHPGILRTWSKHLWDAGFRHSDYLKSLADDKTISVDKLPKQGIKFQAPARGPRHSLNNAARWVPVGDASDPEPVRIPNVQAMTIQERQALLYQFYELGLIPQAPTGPAGSAVEND